MLIHIYFWETWCKKSHDIFCQIEKLSSIQSSETLVNKEDIFCKAGVYANQDNLPTLPKMWIFFQMGKKIVYLRTQCGTSAFKHATPVPMCAVNLPLLNLMVHKNIFRSVILKWSCPSCQLVHHPSSKRNLQFFSQNQAYYNLSFVLFLSCHNCVKNRHNCSVSILGYLNNCVLCTFPHRYRIIFLQLFH